MINIIVPPILIEEFGREDIAAEAAISLMIKVTQRKALMNELAERLAGTAWINGNCGHETADLEYFLAKINAEIIETLGTAIHN